MNEARKTISENIKKLCLINGVKQKDLAEYLGVSQASVSNWINCANSIDIENLVSLCHYFSVSLDQMYGLAPLTPSYELSEQESALIKVFRTVNSDGKELLIQIANDFSKSKILKQ